MKEAVCLNCRLQFEYDPWHKAGKFCSCKCMGVYNHEKAKAEWYAGTSKGIVDRATIRKYLAEDRGYKCEVCSISEWQGKKLTLQVDHTDGNPADSGPKNVRLICPNCHSQTPFLGNGNKGRGRGALGLPLN